MTMSCKGEDFSSNLIKFFFPNLSQHNNESSCMLERAILTLTNEEIYWINNNITSKCQGDKHILYFFDTIDDDLRNI